MSPEPGGSQKLQWTIIALLGVTIVAIGVLIFVLMNPAARPGTGAAPGLGNQAGTPATKTPDAGAPVLTAPEVARDGLYVNGLLLSAGVSQSKVVKELGTEDERYGSKSEVYFAWDMPAGYVSVQFDEVGSLVSATLSTPDEGTNDSSSFASLDGTKVVLGQSTLSDVMKWFPSGELTEILPGEGDYFRDYNVLYGGEGSETMSFGVRWNDDGRSLAQQKTLKITSVAAGYPLQ